jgi:hypothetical protein
MKQKVLQGDLADAVRNPRDFLRIDAILAPTVVSVRLIPPVQEADATSIPANGTIITDFLNSVMAGNPSLKDDSAPPPPSAADTQTYLTRLNTVLSAVNAEKANGTIDKFLSTCRAACTKCFLELMKASWSNSINGSAVTPLVRYVEQELIGRMLPVLEKKIPVSSDIVAAAASAGAGLSGVATTAMGDPRAVLRSTYNTPVTLVQHLSTIETFVNQYRATEINEMVRDWLFRSDVISLFLGCFAMYFRAKYVATFVSGTWNVAGQLSNVSFYDARYARLTLYMMGSSLFDVLILYNSLNNQRMTFVPTLESIRDSYRFQVTSITANDQEAVMKAQAAVATLSNNTKKQSVALYRSDQDLSFRKQSLQTITGATNADAAQLWSQRLTYYAWLMTYVVVVLVSIALIATNRHNMFVLLCIIILGLVLLVALMRVIASIIRRVIA